MSAKDLFVNQSSLTGEAILEELEPDSFRTASSKARLLAGQDNKQEAVLVLTRLLEKKPAELLRPVAAELEAIGLNAEAEKTLRLFVAESQVKSPDSALVLAGFLGRLDADLLEETFAGCFLRNQFGPQLR